MTQLRYTSHVHSLRTIDWQHPDTRAYVLDAIRDAAIGGHMPSHAQWQECKPDSLPTMATIRDRLGYFTTDNIRAAVDLKPPRGAWGKTTYTGRPDLAAEQLGPQIDAIIAAERALKHDDVCLPACGRRVVQAYDARRGAWTSREWTMLR